MSYEPPPPASDSNRPLVIVIFILGGIILLGVVGCAGAGLLGYFWTTQAVRQEAQAAAEALRAETAARQAAQQAAAQNDPERPESGKGLPWGPERAEVDDLARRFLELIREGRLDDAFAMTSAGFRKQRDRQAFGKQVAERPSLRKVLHPYGMVQPESLKDAAIRLRFVSRDGGDVRVEVRVWLGKENSVWRIDNLEVREDKVR